MRKEIEDTHFGTVRERAARRIAHACAGHHANSVAPRWKTSGSHPSAPSPPNVHTSPGLPYSRPPPASQCPPIALDHLWHTLLPLILASRSRRRPRGAHRELYVSDVSLD